jgi:hypothetical protein
VEHWLKVGYPKVRGGAKTEGAKVHWGDEMGLWSDHRAGITCRCKGRTPVTPGTARQ